MLAVAIASLLLSQASEMQASRQAAREESLPLAGGGAALELTPSRDGQLGDLVFRAPLVPGGTDALPAPICINGVCKDPICRYRAKDATATTWPAWGFGETLTKVEVGADTADEDLPHLGRGEKGRRFNVADYYESATTGACDIGTEDFVIEAVVRTGTNAAASLAFAGKRGAANGWMLYRSGGLLYSYINQGGLLNLNSGYSASGTLLHVLIGYDRNYASAAYGARFTINGVNASSQDASSKAATLTNAEKFAIGGTAAGLQTDGAVLYFAVYKQPDWLPGTAANATILDAIAADRSARFWGTRESVGQYAPTFAAAGPRCAWTAAGKLDCYSATAPILGATIPQGMTGAGTPSGGGYLSAPAGTQALLYSRDFLTGWTLTGTTPVATSGVTSPFVDARATYAITDNDGAGEEYISQTLDITALNTGDDIALCPIAAVASSTQVYTLSVTEQTGGSCTTTTTHYKPTATTTWQQQAQAHDVLDGDCTQAVITVRPYDVASGAAATGGVSVLMNAYLGRNYCQPYYVESTTAAVASGQDVLTYDVASVLGTAAQKRQGLVYRSDVARMSTEAATSAAIVDILTAGTCPRLATPASGNNAALYWQGSAISDIASGFVLSPGTWRQWAALAPRTYGATDERGQHFAPLGTSAILSGTACTSTTTTLGVGAAAGQFLPFGTQIRNVEIYR